MPAISLSVPAQTPSPYSNHWIAPLSPSPTPSSNPVILELRLAALEEAAIDTNKYVTLTITKAYTTYTTTILLGNDASTAGPSATVVGPNTVFVVPITTTTVTPNTAATTATTTVPLGAAPVSTEPNNSVLIGATLGGILGAIVLLILIYVCYIYSPREYSDSSSSEGSESSSSSSEHTRPRRVRVTRVAEVRETRPRYAGRWFGGAGSYGRRRGLDDD